jgi:hypothetical protein
MKLRYKLAISFRRKFSLRHRTHFVLATSAVNRNEGYKNIVFVLHDRFLFKHRISSIVGQDIIS